MHIVINLEILNNFQFSSNYRIGSFTIKIPLIIRYLKFRTKAESKSEFIILRYKVERAN